MAVLCWYEVAIFNSSGMVLDCSLQASHRQDGLTYKAISCLELISTGNEGKCRGLITICSFIHKQNWTW